MTPVNQKADFFEAHVALDTNCLWNAFTGDGSLALDCLSALAKDSRIKIHIPSIVLSEVRSHISEQIQKTGVQEALQTLKPLRKITPSRLKPVVGNLETSITSFLQDLEAELTSKVRNWLECTGASILPVGIAHAERVFEKYFSGTAPFKAIKSREDFPDAFIFEAIQDLLPQLDELLVVCNDERLRAAFSTDEKISIFSDLRALLASGKLPIRTIDRDYQTHRLLRANTEKFEANAKDLLIDALEFRILDLASAASEGSVHSIEIEKVSALQNFVLDTSSITMLGENRYLAFFLVDADLLGAHRVENNNWHIDTFNVLGKQVVRDLYATKLKGYLRIDASNFLPGNDDYSKLQLSIESVQATDFEGREMKGVAVNSSRNLRIKVEDGNLKEALRLCKGFVLVIGKGAQRRKEAALTLLSEIANENPNDLFIGPAEALQYNRLSNIVLLDKVIPRVVNGEIPTYGGILYPGDVTSIVKKDARELFCLST
jgi:hypothetical protein